MKTRVRVLNEQSIARVGVEPLKRAVPLLLEKGARSLLVEWSEIRLILLDDAGISAIHQVIMNDSSPTDVITQAFRPQPGIHESWTAELYLNVQRALQEGSRRMGGPGHELLLYLAHGCDHLQGGRDHTRKQRAAMLRRENIWIRGMIPPLIRVRSTRSSS